MVLHHYITFISVLSFFGVIFLSSNYLFMIHDIINKKVYPKNFMSFQIVTHDNPINIFTDEKYYMENNSTVNISIHVRDFFPYGNLANFIASGNNISFSIKILKKKSVKKDIYWKILTKPSKNKNNYDFIHEEDEVFITNSYFIMDKIIRLPNFSNITYSHIIQGDMLNITYNKPCYIKFFLIN